jgi:hypothetical protein
MADLVVTCPRFFWREWLAEGDLAGGDSPLSSTEWGWYIGGRRPPIGRGDRLYVVAWDRLRGWAPVTRLLGVDYSATPHGAYVDAATLSHSDQWCICRRGGAQAVTIPGRIAGFRGWRRPWWPREAEVPFPDWQMEGVLFKRRKAA